MNKTPLAVISSDWHLAPRAWVSAPSICGDSYESLRQICDFAFTQHIPYHLAAGDLFDVPNIDAGSLYRAIECLHPPTSRVSVLTLFVQGQHEMVPDHPWLYFCENTTHLHGTSITLHRENTRPLIVVGLDYRPPHLLQEELDRLADGPPFDVLLTHQTWRPFVSANNTSLNFSAVPHASILVTGDYHQHLTLTTTNREGKPMQVLSPGATCLQSLAEPESKFFFVLYDDLSVESIPLVTRRYFSFQITTEEQLNSLLEQNSPTSLREGSTKLPAVIQNPIVRVRYSSDIPNAYTRLLNHFGTFNHFLEPSSDKKATTSSLRFDNSEVIEECMASVVSNESSVYADALSLYRSRHPELTLQQLEQRFREQYLSGSE